MKWFIVSSPNSTGSARSRTLSSNAFMPIRPAYVAHLGGNYEGGEIAYGARLKVRLAAKRVPEAVERWLRLYEAQREDGEVFNAFVARVGTKAFEDIVSDLAMPIEFGLETMNHFIDWTKKVPFEVVRGEGECAV